MITSEDIAIKIRAKLLDEFNEVKVSWQRSDYEDSKEIVVVPHTATGEGSIRIVVVKVNVHVPDIYDSENKCYEADFSELNNLKKRVVKALKNHTDGSISTNWKITSLDPPIKEQEYNEHFVSVSIEAYIRERN